MAIFRNPAVWKFKHRGLSGLFSTDWLFEVGKTWTYVNIFAILYLSECTKCTYKRAHSRPKWWKQRSRRSFSHCKIQVSKQSWMSVLSFLQRFRFTYRSNAVQSFGRNFQEYSQRCSLLQWEQVLWLWPDPWSTAIQGSWLWRLVSEDSVSCTRQ